MTAFSGVRSSCDMLARNSDLCWLATSSSRVFCSSSWNTRALWMATTDWPASVSRRSTVSAGSAPGRCAGRRARRRSRPRAGAAAPPSSATRGRGARRRVDRAARRRDPAPGAPRRAAAASPMNVPSQPDPDLAQRTDQFRRSCRRRFAARTPRRPRSNSKIEPPSAPESSAARVTIVVRTSPRSRLELTAWLISPSARSSSTEPRQLPLRCSSCWKSSTFRIAIEPCAAKVVRRSIVCRRTDRPRAARGSGPRRRGRRPASARRASCGSRRARARSANGRWDRRARR